MTEPLSRKAWIAALRDRKIKQACGWLMDGCGAMCCLGVGLKVAGVAHTQSYPGDAFQFGRAKTDTMPSPSQRKILGIGKTLADALAVANDGGATFKEIANFLETGDSSKLDDHMDDDSHRCALKRYRVPA